MDLKWVLGLCWDTEENRKPIWTQLNFFYNNGRKHPTRQFYKLFGKSYVLTKFRERSPGKFDLFFRYFFISWKILCVLILDKISWNFLSVVLMIFLPLGKSYEFLQNFEKALLEILMCSSIFCLSWKIYMCSYTIFSSPRKFDVFL